MSAHEPRIFGFIGRLLVSALSLAVAAYVVPGIHVDGYLTLLVAAFLLGIANAVVRPVLIVLTLPMTVLSLGLFLLVINAAMIGLVAWLLPGLSVDGLGAAFFGWLIVSLVSWVATKVLL